MNAVQVSDVHAFYARVEPYLSACEAEHNLFFGILSTIMAKPDAYEQPYFALVEDDAGAVLFALIRTPPRPAILSLAAAPEAVAAMAEMVHGQGIDLPGVHGITDESRLFAEAWSRLPGRTYQTEMQMRTYKLEQVIAPVGVPGFLRRATMDDFEVLAAWEMGFRREAFPDGRHELSEVERSVERRLTTEQAGFYLWDDDGAVSVTGYGGPTPHGIRIGPVYTPPELRGRGYASACAAGVSQTLLDEGYQFCFLFTDLANPTANHIYQAIGYAPVCDFTEYRFS